MKSSSSQTPCRPSHNSVLSYWCSQVIIALPPHVGHFIVSFSVPVEEYVMERIRPAIRRIKSDDFQTKFRGLSRLRQLVGKQDEQGQIAINAVFDHPDLVPLLLTYMDNYRLQFEAEWTIASLTSAPESRVKTLFQYEAIKVLIQKLSSTALEAVDQAVWAIGNLAYSHHTRMTIISYNIVPRLCDIVRTSLDGTNLTKAEIDEQKAVKKSVLRSSVWTISRLCGVEINERAVRWTHLSPCLPILVRVLQESEDMETVSDACCALSNLSEQMSAEAILSTGILPRLVQFLHSNCQFIRAPSLRTIGNILAGSEHHTQEVINCGALSSLSQLLQDPCVYLRKASAWAISNIAAGSHEQIEHVLKSGCLNMLNSMLKYDEQVAAREAGWVVSNILTGGNDAHVRACGDAGCGDAVAALLLRPLQLDDPTVASLADSLGIIMRESCHFISDVRTFRENLAALSSRIGPSRSESGAEIRELLGILDSSLSVESSGDIACSFTDPMGYLVKNACDLM